MVLKNQRPKTIASHRFAFNMFRSFAPEVKEPSQVDTALIEQFFLWGRQQRGWSATTLATYHKRLNVFFDWCVQRALTKFNPVKNVPKPKLERRILKRLSVNEARRVLRTCLALSWDSEFHRARNTAIIATFIYAGLRRSELLNLRLSDVDLNQKLLIIRSGKGAKDRVLPIGDTLFNVLRAYEVLRVKRPGLSVAFFLSSTHDCGVTENGLRFVISRLKKETGLQFYPHLLRHTYATLMLDGGCDIYSLSRLMGHDDIRSTTTYLSASVEHLRKEIEKHPLHS
jgi:site-specific recombinase XerD